MKTTPQTPIDEVLRCLRAARWRLAAQTFLTALINAALVCAAGLVALGGVRRWLFGVEPFHRESTAVAAGAAVLLALLVAVARRQSLPVVAAVLDRLGKTRDRFLTALAFTREAPAEMHALAVRECAQFAKGEDFSRLIRVRLPRETGWLLVPVLALAMLQWDTRRTASARQAETAEAKSEVEDTAKKLEELARQTKEANPQGSDELKKLAEQLQRSAEQLRAQATNPADAAKAALRELSALEQLVQEMQNAPAGATPEELKALAKALAENAATKDAADALEAGDAAKAAAELEKAAQKLTEEPDEKTAEQLRETLEKALQRLAEQKQLSEAMQRLAQQMQRSPAGQGGLSSEAMKQLAELLKNLPKEPGNQPGSGGTPSEQTLQSLLAALQNMKAGEGQPKSGKPQDGKGQGLVAMQAFGVPKANGAPGEGDPTQPSGQPGSEKDTGTTDSPLGKEQNKPGESAQARQLAGRLGEGETLQQLLPAAGDTSKSTRRYKELYEAMAPAAQEAVLQENIPLGSRFFIKRYFESIRPVE